MFHLTKIITVILIWIILTMQVFGAVVIPLPWPGLSMAMPGIILLHIGNPQETAGTLVHELCHIQQIRNGRAGEDVATLELECSCAEYFYYERIGYQPGMEQVLHYDIDG